ncbi:MAG: SRPBCC family protein [Deltaproteobacteria bacterium]|nr:SRPBCC family protein [Deltaproteobacteria bacterium]
MARAEAVETILSPIKKVFEVVTDYEKYPEFIPEMKKVEVLEDEDSVKVVRFHLNLLKPIQYTIRCEVVKSPFEMTWKLIDSDFFKENDGGWKLKKIGDGETQATYYISCDFKMFMPAMIINKIVSAQLPKMLSCFKKRIEGEV